MFGHVVNLYICCKLFYFCPQFYIVLLASFPFQFTIVLSTFLFSFFLIMSSFLFFLHHFPFLYLQPPFYSKHLPYLPFSFLTLQWTILWKKKRTKIKTALSIYLRPWSVNSDGMSEYLSVQLGKGIHQDWSNKTLIAYMPDLEQRIASSCSHSRASMAICSTFICWL